MDDAVARTQGNAAARADEGRQLAVHLDVNELRIGGGVAEELHHHVGRETEAVRAAFNRMRENLRKPKKTFDECVDALAAQGLKRFSEALKALVK